MDGSPDTSKWAALARPPLSLRHPAMREFWVVLLVCWLAFLALLPLWAIWALVRGLW